jgi:hypothetical protein
MRRIQLRYKAKKPLGLRRYEWNEWLRQRPLVDWFKDIRHQRLVVNLLRQPPPDGGAEEVRRQLKSRRVMVTVAFGDAQLIDWQAQLVRRNVPKVLHIIADNSPTPEGAAAVADVARRQQVPIFRLPPNPWNRRSPARSHGLALTWTWHNVIRPGQPKAFGFLDHDIFPIAPCDPFSTLDNQIGYGVRRADFGVSYLWPGFCFFRFDAVQHQKLNFSPSLVEGLETGGKNWRLLYRRLPAGQIGWTELVSELLPDDPDGLLVQRMNEWIHLASLQPDATAEQRQAKRHYLESILAPHLAPAPAV